MENLSFGQKLRKMWLERNKRLKKGESKWTLVKVGKVLGVDSTAVGLWERDQAFPRKNTLKSLAEFYGVSISYLLEEGSTKDETLIGQKIKEAREERKLSVEGLASLSGLSKDTILEIEGRLDNVVDFMAILNISKVLNVGLSSLVENGKPAEKVYEPLFKSILEFKDDERARLEIQLYKDFLKLHEFIKGQKRQ